MRRSSRLALIGVGAMLAVLVVLGLVVGVMATPANAAKPAPVLPPTITETCPRVLDPTYPVSGTATFSFKRKVKAVVTDFDVTWDAGTRTYSAQFTTPTGLKLDSAVIDLDCRPATDQGVFTWAFQPGQSIVLPQSGPSLCDYWFEALGLILIPDASPSKVTAELTEFDILPYQWFLVLRHTGGSFDPPETGTVHWTCVEIPHIDEFHTVQPSAGPEDDVFVGCPEGQTPVEESLIIDSSLGSSSQVEVVFVDAANAFRLRNLGAVEEHIRIQFECAPTIP